jgi:hypothetical protein
MPVNTMSPLGENMPLCPDFNGANVQEVMFWMGGIGAQNMAMEETIRFQGLNQENVDKIRASETDAKVQQANAEKKAEIDQFRRDRKDLAAVMQELQNQLTAAITKLATTKSDRITKATNEEKA